MPQQATPAVLDPLLQKSAALDEGKQQQLALPLCVIHNGKRLPPGETVTLTQDDELFLRLSATLIGGGSKRERGFGDPVKESF